MISMEDIEYLRNLPDSIVFNVNKGYGNQYFLYTIWVYFGLVRL